MTIILSLMLISSTVFAASDECVGKLGSLVLHAKEGARLNAAAIQHGFNIYTGKVEQVDNQSKASATYMKISIDHLEKAEALENEIIKECLK